MYLHTLQALINHFFFLRFQFLGSKTTKNTHFNLMSSTMFELTYRTPPRSALGLCDSFESVHNTLWKLVRSKSIEASNRSDSFRPKELTQALKNTVIFLMHKN